MFELLVAVSLFVIVISIASGAFVQSLRTQRGVLALMSANDNASLALEQIVREIRTGREFVVGGGPLSFVNYLNETVSYDLNNDAIERNGQPITSSNVKVVHLNFRLFGEGVGDGQSTRVLINLGVSSRGGLEGFITPLQTTVSSRILDS